MGRDSSIAQARNSRGTAVVDCRSLLAAILVRPWRIRHPLSTRFLDNPAQPQQRFAQWPKHLQIRFTCWLTARFRQLYFTSTAFV
jgi:hypothetical protein